MAKLIKTIHDFIDYVADKGHTASQKRDQIDTAIYETSVNMFNDYLDVYDRTSTIHEHLSPFEKITAYSGDVSGLYAKPSDYARYTGAWTTTGTNDVSFIKTAMWADRVNDPIDVPSSDNPIGLVRGSDFQINPVSVGWTLTYLKEPSKPNYAYNSDGTYVDSDSTDVEWDNLLFPKLASGACSVLGINIRESQVVQWSEMKKNE